MIVVISGPGGVGKGTLARRLVADHPDFVLSRSWTTRSPRPGEGPDAYTFTDRAGFEAHLAAGGFLEHDEFLGNYYGTPVPEAEDGQVLVLEINLAGARQVRELTPAALVILLLPPDRHELERRLRERGDDEEHIAQRLAIGEEEERLGRTLADVVIVNDDLDRAVGEVAASIAARRADAPPGMAATPANPTPANGDTP